MIVRSIHNNNSFSREPLTSLTPPSFCPFTITSQAIRSACYEKRCPGLVCVIECGHIVFVTDESILRCVLNPENNQGFRQKDRVDCPALSSRTKELRALRTSLDRDDFLILPSSGEPFTGHPNCKCDVKFDVSGHIHRAVCIHYLLTLMGAWCKVSSSFEYYSHLLGPLQCFAPFDLFIRVSTPLVVQQPRRRSSPFDTDDRTDAVHSAKLAIPGCIKTWNPISDPFSYL